LIVIDASVLANVIADDAGDGQRARDAIREADGLSAPEQVDVETVAVLRKRWFAGTLSDGRFAAAVNDLVDLDVDRYPALPLLRRAYELRANVSPYDATYVALAEGLACALVTADARLANAPGATCEIRLLESE
jgi:predicted nucleic acid-binding protein